MARYSEPWLDVDMLGPVLNYNLPDPRCYKTATNAELTALKILEEIQTERSSRL
jgi:hypothetical protein